MLELTRHQSKTGLAYTRAGNGPLLLLIHGVGMRAENWYQQIPFFAKSRTTLCVDLPGHGHSAMQALTSLSDYVQVLAKFIDEVLVDTGQPNLSVCGHSLGALITTKLAAAPNSKLNAGIAISPIHNRSTAALQAVQARAAELQINQAPIEVDVTLQRWFGSPPIVAEQQAYDYCRAWLASNNKDGYAAAYKAFAEIQSLAAETLSSIQCPMLYCTGEFDPNSTPAMAKQLAAATVQASVASIEGARHMLTLTHAEQLNAQVENFLARSLHSSAVSKEAVNHA